MADSSDLTALLLGEDLPQVQFVASSSIASKGSCTMCSPRNQTPVLRQGLLNTGTR